MAQYLKSIFIAITSLKFKPPSTRHLRVNDLEKSTPHLGDVG